MSQQRVENGGGAAVAESPKVRRVAPAVDIFEREDGLVLLADLPGAKEGDVKIDVDKDVLTISARFGEGGFAPGVEFYSELWPREYYRAFQLGELLDSAHITAKMRNGVLELVLPKAERAKTRKIEVKAG